MNRIFCFVLLLSFASCKEITFREPQPVGKKDLKSIPKSLLGKYLTSTDSGGVSKDTIVILSNGYRFGYFDPAERAAPKSEYDDAVLSDKLVLRTFRGYYFVNVNENPEWIVRVIKRERNGDLSYFSPGQEGVDFNVFMKKLSKQIPIDSVVVNEERLYQIKPTPNQLVALIENGYFSKTTLKKIK
jgi:hypothetical protein